MNNVKWGIISGALAVLISITLGLIGGVSFVYILLRAALFGAFFFGAGFGIRFIINNYFPDLMFREEESESADLFEQPGTRVNITLDNYNEYAVPEMYDVPGGSRELGNIEDLLSGAFTPRQENRGIDRKKEEGYNTKRGAANIPEIEPVKKQDEFQDMFSFDKDAAEKQAFIPVFDDDSDGLGNLPDLDAMAMAFSGKDGSSFTAGSQEGNFRPSGPAVNTRAAEVPSFDDDSGLFDRSSSSFDSSSSSGIFSDSSESQPSRAGNKPVPLEGDFNPKELAAGIRTVLNKDK